MSDRLKEISAVLDAGGPVFGADVRWLLDEVEAWHSHCGCCDCQRMRGGEVIGCECLKCKRYRAVGS